MSPPRPPRPARWSVGELSQASGLSVRVLRHWEDMGLLTADRSPSGHRRYGPVQVTRLYQALALRRTGLGLSRIAALLDEADPDPLMTLQSHVAEMDADLRRRGALRDRLAGVLRTLEDPDPATASDSGGQAPILMKVIETMTMFEQYVHGYHSTEIDRLHDQAGTLVELLHSGTCFAPGSLVLEVGSAVGAQTVTLAERNPGVILTGIDVSRRSLAEARRRVDAAGIGHSVTLVEADVFDLPHDAGPLSAGRFDHVFVCFLLEHLPRPTEALVRLHAMLKPGGTITVIEGDHGSTYFHPENAAARDAIACQVSLQRLAGGDALIGRRLYPLLNEAGYRQVTATPRQVYVDASRPDLVDGFIRHTFIAMIDGVRQSAIAAGLTEPDHFDDGVRNLHRTTEPDGGFCYTFFKATATTDEAVATATTPATPAAAVAPPDC